MKKQTDYSNIGAVCDDCAQKSGFTPKDKPVGVWKDECGICHEKKPCTNLWHDWNPPKKIDHFADIGKKVVSAREEAVAKWNELTNKNKRRQQMSNYSITIERLTDWKLVKQLAYATVSKDTDKPPSEDWKRKMLKCEHSPIRAMIYKIELTNIPYYVSVHLSRHKFGVEHYVSTQRTDRTGEDRNGKRQDAPINHTMIVNAAALIFMSRKRLCNLADETTSRIWFGVKNMMACIGEHEMADAMRPECTYRNGICPEMKPCGMRSGVL